jgi:hypothetical protein
MIDGGNTEPWPRQVREAAARFKQGDVIERPPFFYGAVPLYPIWQLTRTAEPLDAEPELLELAPSDAPPFGIITTQTCDLDEQADVPKQPWFQVAPVYITDDLSSDIKRSVERFMVGHFVRLTGPNFREQFWAADLRILLPLEKGCLVGREPIEAFADEDGYNRFAHHLARRFGRPALAINLQRTIIAPLRRRLQKLRGARRAALLEDIVELRLETTPSRLVPSATRRRGDPSWSLR